MIVCKQCGHHNEDSDTFCGSCGKFLEWTGERVVVAQPEPEPVAPEPEPEPVHLGLIDRVKQAVGIEETAAPPAAPVEATPVPALATSVASPVAAPTAVVAPEPVLVGVAAPAPPSAAATTELDEPASRRPTSIAPTVTRPRPGPRTLEPPSRRHPGDLICGQCGEGNDPVRHFCRRCGNALDEALVVRLPWFRRFLNRVVGVRTREAGWRPHRVGPPNVMGMVWRIIRLAIGAIIIVALLAFLFIPSFHNLVVNRATTAFTTVRKLVHPNFDPIYPIGASASTATAGHPPTLAIDRFTNTYWAALPGDHAPTLVLRFATPEDLAEIGFTSGAAGTATADQFLAQPRPHQVHLVFSDGTSQDLTLTDSEKAQFSPITARAVTFVEIHVLSMWPTAGAPPSSVAITEVEFRVKD
ncbi:MAG: hypothetical protein E6I70_15790 [Chloroflexi bacterium]|nr:MAG: hypothetical protein E6I70_15790 [Chloroflexota bacterium]